MSTMVDLRGRHLMKLADFTSEEITYLIDLAAELKVAKREGREEQKLVGKEIALIFEKDSTRTRCAFEVAAYDQGAHVTFIGPGGSHMGHKETVKDTARVLGRMYDAIEYRGFAQETAEELARWAGVPIYNGLTDEWHPTQILADFLTFREHVAKPLNEVVFCYLGDARFNMADSYLIGGAKLGMDVRIASPKSCGRATRSSSSRARPPPRPARDHDHRGRGRGRARRRRAAHRRLGLDGRARRGRRERIELLTPYQVNAATMVATGNAAVKFMHCLPAFHNTETEVGKEIFEKFAMDSLEVTEDVFESPASLVLDEAENRLHTIKAVMVATLGATLRVVAALGGNALLRRGQPLEDLEHGRHDPDGRRLRRPLAQPNHLLRHDGGDLRPRRHGHRELVDHSGTLGVAFVGMSRSWASPRRPPRAPHLRRDFGDKITPLSETTILVPKLVGRGLTPAGTSGTCSGQPARRSGSA